MVATKMTDVDGNNNSVTIIQTCNKRRHTSLSSSNTVKANQEKSVRVRLFQPVLMACAVVLETGQAKIIKDVMQLSYLYHIICCVDRDC